MKNNIRVNVIINIIRTVVLTLLSFITFPWVCRALGDNQVGLYTWANTFVAYFLILAKVGLPNLAIRECVKVRDDKEKLSNRAQTFFLIQLVTTVLSFGLMCAVIFSVPQLREINSLIFILSINFLAGVFSFEWIFIALEKQFYMSVRSIVSLTLSAILIVAFVTNPDDLYIYAFIAILTTVITSIVNCYYVRRYISFKKTMPYDLKQFVKPLAILCSLTLVISLYNQTDTFILGFIDNSKAEVASYSVGIKGVDIIIGIITALSTVFIPRAAYYFEKEDKRFFNNLNRYSVNICLFVVLPAIITMSVLSKEICGLISGTYDYSNTESGYLNAPYILMILSSMMVTYSIGDIIYGQILLPQKKEKYYLMAIGIGTVINIALSIILGGFVFKKNPAIGVAIGTMATDVMVSAFLISITWKWSKQALFNKNNLKLIIANAIILGLSLGLYFPLNLLWKAIGISGANAYLLQMITIVFIDAIAYIIICFLLKESLVYSFSKKRKQERIEEENLNA